MEPTLADFGHQELRRGPRNPDVIEAVCRLFQLTCDECGADADLSAVVLPVEKRAGVQVRAIEA